MATMKRPSKKTLAGQETGPRRAALICPATACPKTERDCFRGPMTERMAEAQNYWVCTVSPDGQPHSTPVWGLWLDDRLYFGGGPQTRRNRNLAENPAVCVHLESGSDVVILHGDAQVLREPDLSLVTRLIEISKEVRICAEA